MGCPDRDRLRETFDQDPEGYKRARPTYPAELFDDLAVLAHLGAGSRIVEIGPGTGQATGELARRGYRVTGIELGAGLAALARQRLAAFPDVEIVTSSFETWQPRRAEFDAVVAFTSFHWLDPEVRYERAARLLRRDGVLAIVSTRHVLSEDGDSIFADLQADYRGLMPGADAGPPPHPDAVAGVSDEIDASGRFRTIASRRYLWDVSYTADQYIALLDTYSGHRLLELSKRKLLYARIRKRIEGSTNSTISKSYLATLDIARPASQSPSSHAELDRSSASG